MTRSTYGKPVGFPIWGLDFLEDIHRTPIQELIAAMLVISVAESSLRLGKIDPQRLIDARRAFCLVSDIPLRLRFLGILRDSSVCSPDWPRPLAAGLVAYATDLHRKAHFLAAIDVYSAVADSRFIEVEDRKEAVAGRAFACRDANRLDQAAMAYRQMDEMGAESGDVSMMLRASVGLARLTLHRGDLVAAFRELERVAAAARSCGAFEIAANVEIDIGHIHGTMGRPHKVIEGAILAEPHLSNPADRDRLLMNTVQAVVDEKRTDLLNGELDWLAANAQELQMRRDAEALRRSLEYTANVRPATSEELDELGALCAVLRQATG